MEISESSIKCLGITSSISLLEDQNLKMTRYETPMPILAQLTSSSSSPSVTDHPPFLNPKIWQEVTLIEKIILSHNTRKFRFAFGHPLQPLGLPVGKHIFLKIKTNGSPYIRAYTPTSLPNQQGHIDLVIKIYFKDTNPQFPDGGVVSQYLESMSIGEKISVKGPTGGFTFCGTGQYSHSSGRKGKCHQIGMICGGTGITPMYQIMQAVLLDKTDGDTKMSLIFGNRTKEDILMRDEIEKVAEEMGEDRFRHWHVLSEEKSNNWEFSIGRINKEIIGEHLFPDQWDAQTSEDLSTKIILLCGPSPMITKCCLPILTELYGKEFVSSNVFCF
jgi:NAD(P)H-flavin reductase